MSLEWLKHMMTNFRFSFNMENKCRNENTNTYIIHTFTLQMVVYSRLPLKKQDEHKHLHMICLSHGCFQGVRLKETFKCICTAWFWLWSMNGVHTHRQRHTHMHIFMNVTGHPLWMKYIKKNNATKSSSAAYEFWSHLVQGPAGSLQTLPVLFCSSEG